MGCGQCGATNPGGSRFCAQCGASLQGRCRSCDAVLQADARFCGQCGAAVEAVAAPIALAAEPSDGVPGLTAERRRVSVLFVDLVGFTALSGDRDPEAVRELLGDYFDRARTLVHRYGGTIEKFIGDAVMAVWGTPVTREDDAERAVRAGLDLIDAVTALGEDRAVPGLQARAGVVTGEAAVRLDTADQGMVVGDVVNTASRVQTVAQPEQVLVDDETRQASARSISYAAAGEHLLKGKVDPVGLYAALEVVAGSGGAQRSGGLEPPFLGRDRDLRMLKELVHDGIEQSRAQLVVVTGGAGLGKSRLAWEFFKYVDGIEQMVYWHMGRCLAYGEGIAYWALAEMLRMRLRIGEGGAEAETVERLDTALERHIGDPAERAWLRPRLKVLLGAADVPTEGVDRDSLFAGWRLFFERLAADAPVVMVFEDMQDADEGLLDFIEHMLQFSADLPLFLLVLARPELHDRRPAWGRQRNETVLHLDRLPDERVEDMVAAMVDGLPDVARTALATRAEGVPLFAIETVRMLIDRDIVVSEDGRFVLAADVGEFDDLEVPPTLQALAGARLDDLPEEHRRLVGGASILGQSFTRDALEAVVRADGDVSLDGVDRLLQQLVDREVLTLRADARSPDAGQYRFVQKVMRMVAQQRLSRDDRKVRHLAAAEHFQGVSDAGDIAGVIATHYLGAAEARPEDPDASEFRATAVHHLERAGDRARSLAAIEEALRYYERALELTDDEAERARLSEAAGTTAQLAAKFECALEHLVLARTILQERGDRSGVARVASWQVETLMDLGRLDDAFALSRFASNDDQPDAEQARLAASIAMIPLNYRQLDESAGPWLERAARDAEATGAWDVLGRALSLKGAALAGERRPVEAEALSSGAFHIARRHGSHFRAALQAGYLAHFALERDLDEAQAWVDEGIVHARLSGDRHNLAFSQDCQAMVQFERGDWDRVDLEGLHALWVRAGQDNAYDQIPAVLVVFAAYLDDPTLIVDGLSPASDDEPLFGLGSPGIEAWEGGALLRQAVLAAMQGDHERAIRAAARSSDFLGWSILRFYGHLLRSILVDAGIHLGCLEVVREAISGLDGASSATPVGAAHRAWACARLGAAEGDELVAEEGFVGAAGRFRDRERPFWLGRVLLDHAEWVASEGDPAHATDLASEARDIFTRLGAVDLSARASRLTGEGAPG